MRLVIDAVPLLIQSAGVKNYLYYWIEHLKRITAPGVVRTFPSFEQTRPLTHERSLAGFWTTWSGLAALACANYIPLPVADWLARGADIFHTTNLLHRPPRRPRLTTTIHDITSWLMPELHSAANLRADESFARVLQYADAAIAVSESTKSDAVRILGLAPDKITVIYPGISGAFFHVPAEEIGRVRNRYVLQKPFLLTIGTIEPRKNLDTLLDAYDALSSALRKQFELVIAGPVGWARPETVKRLARVRYLGYIPEADVAPLTAAATVFVYPSLYEGFGFPVAQALAAGIPVVTSNVSSLPEIAADAALLIDPRSPGELTKAIERLLLSNDLRAELAIRGRRRAADFRWGKCAAESVRFFEQVLEK